MKKMMLSICFLTISVLLFGSVSSSLLSGNDTDGIKAAIKTFAKSADKHDVAGMDAIMHKEYRTVANRLFGSEDVAIIDKATYLSMLRDKKLGGDDRKVSIGDVKIIGNNAFAEVTFTGKQLVFQSFLQLVKTVSGEWKIISDLPKIDAV